MEQHECSNREDTNSKTGICFNFEKKGACLIIGCKCIHMDRNASYSSCSIDLKSKRSNTEKNDHKFYRSDRNDNRNRFKPERICYDFANTRHCRFGHKCKYRHINHSSSLEFDFKARDRSNSNNYYTNRPRSVHTFNNANFNRKFTRADDFKECLNFLGELKDIVKSLKRIIESHHVT